MSDKRETITIKLTPGKDDDLIRWWREQPRGDPNGGENTRQHVAKTALRAALGLPLQVSHDTTPKPSEADPDELADLRQQLDTLTQEHADLLRWAQDVDNYIRTPSAGVDSLPQEEAEPTGLSGEEMDQRAAKLKRAKW